MTAARTNPARFRRPPAIQVLLAGLCLILGLARTQGASAADDKVVAPRVRVETSQGSFVVELNTERAPLTSANFLDYVKSGHYTGTVFHRVISNFVIQGGGFDTSYKLKPSRAPVSNESGNGLSNKRGTVGIARSDLPHSGNCQFYVNVNDNEDLDPQPLRWGYAVFGKVVEGMDVVDKISRVPTGSAGPLPRDAPSDPVVIKSATLLNPPPAAPAAPAVPSAPTATAN